MARLMLIGQFAAITRISVRMLRHYDERGLLRPVQVDPRTGYRYYSAGQASTAEIIRLLRSFDMPLNQIAAALDDSRSGNLAVALARHREKIEVDLGEKRGSLAYLERLISYVDENGDFPSGDIQLEFFEEQQIISRRDLRTLDDVGVFTGQTIGQLYVHVVAGEATSSGAPFAIYRQPVDELDRYGVEVCLPVLPSNCGNPPYASRIVSGGTFAVLKHIGPYESLGIAYRALGTWMLERGLDPVGPPREIYLTSPRAGLQPEDYRTDVAWPVAPVSVREVSC